MALIQNYIGLDARIEAIVRALMGDVNVDLTDYYTKEEVDALIASGGTGLQINYNDLLNRPIIDGLMQSSLDLNGHFLLYNSQRLYSPAVIDNIITFDSDVSIPNVYTKTEVDDLIAGGVAPIDAYTKEETNNLLALKANVVDVYTKAECDEKFSGGGSIGTDIVCKSLTIEPLLTDSLNGTKFTSDATHAIMAQMLQSGGSTTELFKFDANGKNMALLKHAQYALNDDDPTYTAHNFEFVKSAEGKKSKLNITADEIEFYGQLNDIYTKTEVDSKFDNFTTTRLKVNTLDVYPTGVTPGTGDLFANMYLRGTTAEDAFLRLGFENTYYSIYNDSIHLETQKATIGILPYVVEILYDQATDTNKLISNKSLNISTLDASNKIVIANELDIQKLYIRQEGDDIMSFRFIESSVSYPEIFNVNVTDRTCTVTDFDMKCRNIYTKTEVDDLIAGGGGSIPDPLNVNNLTVSKRLNIQSKDTTDESVKGYIQVAGRNTSEYYLSMGLQYGIIDVYPDRVDYGSSVRHH